MGALWGTWRGWVREQRWSLLALVVLLALGVAIGLASLAGARRTASAYERVLELANAPDIISGHALPPAEAAETARTLDGVEAAYTDVGFTGFVRGHDPTLVPFFIGAYDHANVADRHLLVAGSYPDPEAADEALITERAAERAGLSVGDEITVAFFTPAFEVVEEPLRIVGIGRERRMVTGDASLSRDALIFGQGFTRQHLDLQIWSRTTFVADDLDALTEDLVELDWPVDETRAADHERAQNSVQPIVLSLAAIGVVALLATLLVVHQSLARQHNARQRPRLLLRAVGATSRDLRITDLLATATVVVPGVVVGTVGAIALSGLSPVGSVRRIDPDVGVHADWLVLLIGALLVTVVLTAASLRVAGRQERADASSRTLKAPGILSGRPEVSAGVTLAIGSSRYVRQAFWTTAVLTVSTVALMIGAVTFIHTLERLTESPARYGFGWDVVARNPYGSIDRDALIDAYGDDPEVAAIAAGTARSLVVNGRHAVPGMLLTPVTEEFWPTIDSGRAPRTPDEVLMGRSTLEDLGVQVGDLVTVDAAGDDGVGAASERIEVEIVGTAIFPPIELAGVDPARLGIGMTLPFEAYQELVDVDSQPQGLLQEPDMVYFDLVEGADPAAFVAEHPEGVPDERRVPTEWLVSVAPAEVLESNEALPLLWATLVPLAIVVLATVGHAQLLVVRRRRKDYGILRALGFTRREVLTTVGWQATVTVLVPVVLAVPLGLIGGQVGWRGFAGLIGVDDSSAIPLLSVLGVAVVAIVLTNLVCLLPAMVAARVRPAQVLRGE